MPKLCLDETIHKIYRWWGILGLFYGEMRYFFKDMPGFTQSGMALIAVENSTYG